MLPSQPNGKPPGRKQNRPLETCPGACPLDMVELDMAGGPGQRGCQGLGVEALPDRLWIARVFHNRGVERGEPVQGSVELFDDSPLQDGIAAGALGPEILERAVAPDDPAREQHRAARTVALLEHDRFGAELARPRGRDEAGHPRSGDRQVGYLSANVGFCSTYSIFTPSGPQTKIA